MRRADSEDYLLHDEEEQRELRAFGFGGLGSSSDSEDEQRPKRRRLESTDAIGLDLVMGQALHPLAPGVAGAPAAAAAIDASEEAEASLLQLEVEGLLREARPDGGAEAALLRQLQHLATLLRGLPQAEVAAGGLIRGFLADLGFRPVRPFTFRPPARVQVVGSFALCASVLGAQPPCVDLALLMPPACFDSKDQLNHRYHAKRALYLAHLAAVLKKQHPEMGEAAWECLADEPRRPVLVVTPPAGTSRAGFHIRLLPVAPLELCPLAKLGPERNNLRAAVVVPPPPAPPPPAPEEQQAAGGGKKGKKQKGGKQQQQQQQQKQKQPPPAPPPEPQLLPTPHYNTTVLQDMLMLSLADQCRAAAAGCRYFSDAAAMLRVWALQQQLSQGADGLSGTLLTLLLVHLLETGQASTHMTAMHLFRTVLVALSGPKTFTPGLFMQRRAIRGAVVSGDAPSPPTSKAWRRAFGVVFVDPSGWLNLAASLSKSALAQARDCAARTLQLLNAGTPEAFDSVFLARRRQAALCDYWLHVRVPQPAAAGGPSTPGTPGGGIGGGHSTDLLRDQPVWRALEQQVEALAAKALGTRAQLVRAFRRTLRGDGGSGAPLKTGALRPAQDFVLLGVQVNPTAVLRTLDMGPSADKTEEARAFRAFWGDKAELRRFQDGAIAEALVWEEGGPAGRHLIVDAMLRYALCRHLPAGTSVTGLAGALDRALHRKHSSLDADVQATKLCEAAAERLGKRLRSLASDSLPLRVVAVQPLAPVLRHAAAFPPLPHLLAGAPRDALASDHVARCLQPVELLCQLEGSGKWPDNVEAFGKMKAAVGCQLAMQLQQALGLEAQASEEWVDVLTDGFAFRLLLATERDAAMQQKVLAMTGQAQVAVDEDMPLRTWHQGAISGVAGANPAFEPSARLVKRWLGAHLLSPHLREEAAELLLAHIFTSPAAPPPGSRISGLLRFLQLLSEHPWRVQPLIVDPSGELSAAQRDGILRKHGARRADGSAPALCIATPRDLDGGAWTAGGRPTSQVLHRVVVLAQRSAAALERLLVGDAGDAAGAAGAAAGAAGGEAAANDGASGSEEGEAAAVQAALAAVFSRDLAEYDAVIRLRPDALPNAANDLRLGAAAAAASSAAAVAARRPQLGPALQAANAQLEQAVAAAAEAPSAKQSRAVLKGIPHSVLQARGHHAVRQQLLVGFDPLPPFTALLQRHLGGLAVACADFVGGSLVALKWRPAAFAPTALAPEEAHLVCPAGAPEAAAAEELAARQRQAGRQQQARGGDALSATAVVPDVVGALRDVLQLGAGLVESIHLQ